ncbi:DUF1427 family protein [Streptomyces sp. TYQ1024]|nr:DUF1427 family protein [Streptomyces sp. TYQ1024]
MGAVYWALDIASPAPPLVGLAGLAGIVLGERAATAARRHLARHRSSSVPSFPDPHSDAHPDRYRAPQSVPQEEEERHDVQAPH